MRWSSIDALVDIGHIRETASHKMCLILKSESFSSTIRLMYNANGEQI